MPPVSVTQDWDAIASTTVYNWSKTIPDNIGTNNAFFYWLRQQGNYKLIDDIGQFMVMPLRYENAQADAFSKYDPLSVTPIDGITSSLWNWRQASAPIVISEFERKQNGGKTKMFDLLEAKTDQAEDGIREFMGRTFLQGNGVNGGNLHDPYISGANGSYFIDPLPRLVKYDPTTSLSVGNIDQSTYSWWRNQKYDGSAFTTFAGFMKGLRNLYNLCSKGPGGSPDFSLCDQGTFELYEAALASLHQNPSYANADIPFNNIKFRGNTIMWDEYVPDVYSNTPTIVKGSLFMLNSKFFNIKVHRATNFATTEFRIPVNGDSRVAHVLFLGGVGTSQRRKHGVMGNIALTIAA